MWVMIGLLAGAMIGAGAMSVWYGRELTRMAAFLRDRPAEGSARLTVGVPGAPARELAAAVNDQLDRIQAERVAARARQDEFQRDLSALSHDVRTPLMGVRGHVQLALDDLADGASPASSVCESAPSPSSVDVPRETAQAVPSQRASLVRHLTVAASRLDQMRSLLDQLFDYARANDPDREPKVEAVALHPLLAQVLVGHYPEFEARHWEPTIDFADESVVVVADRASLTRMLENLTVNALRHGGGAPLITERVASGDAGRVTLTFANPVPAGVAIDPERLFARFYQADESRGGGGAGLGLAVVRSLADRMGMTVDAALGDAPSGGGTLTIRLTMREADA